MSKNGPLIKSLGYGPTIKLLNQSILPPQSLIVFTTPEHKKESKKAGLKNNAGEGSLAMPRYQSKRIIIDLDHSGQRLPLNRITKGSSLIIYKGGNWPSAGSQRSALPSLILGGKYLNHYLPGPKTVTHFVKFCELEASGARRGQKAMREVGTTVPSPSHPTGLVLIKLLTAAVKKWQQ
jgi:hypothetical protein